MMKCTDRHFRYLMRLINKDVLLYTEMITMDAILHGNREWLLGYDQIEHPIAVQLGGSDPKKLAECAKISEDYGYDEVNLNVGCPSDRVQSGTFGACLMKDPTLVAKCVTEMKSKVNIPVTVKCRIGVDEFDSYEYLHNFVKQLVETEIDALIVHARKAWLNGLSPKDNRTIPPLRYDVVYQLKQDFPDLTISINGGINSPDEIQPHLQKVDGVMIGRAAYNNPYMFADSQNTKSRKEIIEEFLPYAFEHVSQGVSLNKIAKHMMGMFHGMPHGKHWRRMLSTELLKTAEPLKMIEAFLNK